MAKVKTRLVFFYPPSSPSLPHNKTTRKNLAERSHYFSIKTFPLFKLPLPLISFQSHSNTNPNPSPKENNRKNQREMRIRDASCRGVYYFAAKSGNEKLAIRVGQDNGEEKLSIDPNFQLCGTGRTKGIENLFSPSVECGKGRTRFIYLMLYRVVEDHPNRLRKDGRMD